MKKIITVCLIIILLLLLFNDRISITIDEIILPKNITNINSYSTWLESNISHKKEILDYWQKPSITLRKKTGDCEDIAILNNQVLNQLGIKSKMYCIILKYNYNHHVVCIFENSDGTYSLIDNQDRFYTKYNDPISLILEDYPTCIYIGEFKPTKYGFSSLLSRVRSKKRIWSKNQGRSK